MIRGTEMIRGTKTTSTTEGSGTGTVILTTGTTAIGMRDTGTIGTGTGTGIDMKIHIGMEVTEGALVIGVGEKAVRGWQSWTARLATSMGEGTERSMCVGRESTTLTTPATPTGTYLTTWAHEAIWTGQG